MTLAQKIQKLLESELKPESIKTVIEMAEFLKFKESQNKWNEINESDLEYISAEEKAHIQKLKEKGEFIDQEDLLKELGINKDDIQS